jgi:flagellar biosynthetic protein FlhB
MADEDQGEKTEEPTERKLEDARKEGQVAQSKEIKNASTLIAGIVLVAWIAPFLMKQVANIGAYYISHVHDVRVTNPIELRIYIFTIGTEFFKLLAIPFALFIFCAIVSEVAQVGFMFTPKKIEFDPNKLNPVSGLKRMFSTQKLVDTLKDIIKIIVVALVCYIAISPRIAAIPALPSVSILGSLDLLKEICVIMIFAVAILMTIVAAADWFWTRYSHRKKLRMSKKDLKDEHKQMEGDPKVKAKLHSIRMEKFRQRMLQSVPTATVVVTNPTHYAVALKYDIDDMMAPLVVAKGVDFLAGKIKEIANENDVTIVENPPLARALYASVDVNEEVPPEHFKAVAEVIGYVMRLKGQLPN